ncbi:MAG TPA: hypothetical protein PLH19_00340 [Anaerolineae bacterium]|nr:hypothetical protein [Anaerolineae bacterium]HQH36970.1 hypothetical protein [Anaerolineae bacterium]
MAVVLIGIGLAFGVDAVASAPALQEPPFSYANGRFGFGWTRKVSNVQARGWPAYLNAGWYWDWAARGATQLPPLQYVQTVRLSPVKSGNVQIGYTASPTGTVLLTAIAQQLGATWFIGNEPDCNTMDNMRSEWYARAYHDLYYLIKNADPTAKIAAGNIVQPTPQRFLYLDRVLAEYQTRYGEPLPADLWSIHSYILCETCYPVPPHVPGEPAWAWGACFVPDWPSQSQSAFIGTFYSVYDHWDIDIFAERIRTFRQWMYDNGYRYHPLVIPEYGVLFYEGLVYSGATYDAKSREFMYAGFDWMQSARDPVTGYRPDDGRLVQGWAWFSLDHGDYPGGTLFDPYTYQPTTMGRDYAAYTAQVTPTVDLLTFDPYVTTPVTEAGTPVTATVHFTVSNAGNIAFDSSVVAKLIGNSPVSPTYYTVIGASTLGQLACCGGYDTVALPWPNYIVGEDYDFYATVLETDLNITHVWTTAYTDTATPVTATLYTTVSNRGYKDIGEPLTVTFFYNTSISIPLGSMVIPELGCCGNEQTVAISWPNLTDGYYPFCVTATTTQLQSGPVCVDLWINPRTIYLPLVAKNY